MSISDAVSESRDAYYQWDIASVISISFYNKSIFL